MLAGGDSESSHSTTGSSSIEACVDSVVILSGGSERSVFSAGAKRGNAFELSISGRCRATEVTCFAGFSILGEATAVWDTAVTAVCEPVAKAASEESAAGFDHLGM
jgi:hypothetical protein